VDECKPLEVGDAKALRMGGVIVEFDDAKLAFGEKPILDGFSYAFSKVGRCRLTLGRQTMISSANSFTTFIDPGVPGNSVWAFNLAPAVPRGARTLCPRLCNGVSPRGYTEMG
jgi:hypothetical protein